MQSRRNSPPLRAGRPRSPRPPFQHPSPEARPRTGFLRIWRYFMTSKSIVGADKLSDLIRAAPLGALLRYADGQPRPPARFNRSEEHTSELQSLMRNSYTVFCLKKKKTIDKTT